MSEPSGRRRNPVARAEYHRFMNALATGVARFEKHQFDVRVVERERVSPDHERALLISTDTESWRYHVAFCHRCKEAAQLVRQPSVAQFFGRHAHPPEIASAAPSKPAPAPSPRPTSRCANDLRFAGRTAPCPIDASVKCEECRRRFCVRCFATHSDEDAA